MDAFLVAGCRPAPAAAVASATVAVLWLRVVQDLVGDWRHAHAVHEAVFGEELGAAAGGAARWDECRRAVSPGALSDGGTSSVAFFFSALSFLGDFRITRGRVGGLDRAQRLHWPSRCSRSRHMRHAKRPTAPAAAMALPRIEEHAPALRRGGAAGGGPRRGGGDGRGARRRGARLLRLGRRRRADLRRGAPAGAARRLPWFLFALIAFLPVLAAGRAPGRRAAQRRAGVRVERLGGELGTERLGEQPRPVVAGPAGRRQLRRGERRRRIGGDAAPRRRRRRPVSRRVARRLPPTTAIH
eukprot:gene11950-biopygen9426